MQFSEKEIKEIESELSKKTTRDEAREVLGNALINKQESLTVDYNKKASIRNNKEDALKEAEESAKVLGSVLPNNERLKTLNRCEINYE